MPAERAEDLFSARDAIHPLVEAYFASTVNPAWERAQGAMQPWLGDERTKALFARLKTEMRLAQSSAEFGYVGIGEHGSAMLTQLNAIRSLRSHLAYRKDTTGPMAALDTLENTMRQRAMDEGIYPR